MKLTSQQFCLSPLLTCSIHRMNPFERKRGLNVKAERAGVVCTYELKRGGGVKTVDPASPSLSQCTAMCDHDYLKSVYVY